MFFPPHVARIINRLGRPVQYKPQVGLPRTINAVFDSNYVAIGFTPELNSAAPSALCVASDLVGVRDKDLVGVDGTDYRVMSIQSDGDGAVRLMMHKV